MQSWVLARPVPPGQRLAQELAVASILEEGHVEAEAGGGVRWMERLPGEAGELGGWAEQGDPRGTERR